VPQTTDTRDERPRRASALLVATLASFLTPFTSSSVNVALPTIGRAFDADTIELSWVAMGFLLSAAVFLVPFGRAADIYGRKRVFMLGVLLFTLASVLCAVSWSTEILIASRILQGCGGAMIFGTSVAILTSVYPPEQRGKVLGLNVSATYLGLSLGPFLGGFVTKHAGWQGVFLATVPVGLIILCAVWWKLRGEWSGAKGEKFDLVGSVVYGGGLIALMYGLSRLPEFVGLLLMTAGIVGLLAFVWWEQRTASPILHIALFRVNTVFAFSNLAAMINYSATFAVTFLVSLYLQFVRGLGPQEAGLILVAQPVVMTLTSPIAGRLSDTLEPRLLASSGMALTSGALFLLVFIDASSSIVYVIGALLLLGAGFGLFSSPNTNAVMSSVERRYYGVASATLGTMRLTGQMLSMGIAAVLLALYVGRVQVTPASSGAFLTSFRVAFIIFSVLCALGVPASFARGKTRGPGSTLRKG
jgi:EmrB/QacA subfamily drug resistance transporter